MSRRDASDGSNVAAINLDTSFERGPHRRAMASVSKIDVRRDSQSNKTVGVSAAQPSNGASVIDVLDHVLDKGIVIDAWMKVSLVGIDLVTVEARVLVASIETYVQQAEAVSHFGALAAGQLAGGQLPIHPRPKISHPRERHRS
jgi:hypothetical protein